MQRITPFLWFDNQAEEAVRFYTAIFDGAPGQSAHYDAASAEVSGQPEGSVMTVTFQLQGQEFIALNGGPHFQFNEAISLVVNCEGQDEVDYYWQRLTEGGEPGQCGWLKDRFGVSWQVVPSALHQILGGPDPEAAHRATQAMLQMSKLDIAALQAAYDATA